MSEQGPGLGEQKMPSDPMSSQPGFTPEERSVLMKSERAWDEIQQKPSTPRNGFVLGYTLGMLDGIATYKRIITRERKRIMRVYSRTRMMQVVAIGSQVIALATLLYLALLRQL